MRGIFFNFPYNKCINNQIMLRVYTGSIELRNIYICTYVNRDLN